MFHTNFDERQKLWSGHNSPPLYNPEVSFGKVIYHALRVHGTKVAQISDDSGISLRFDEILSKSTRAALNLQALGYKKGDIFGFIATNSYHLSPIVFAAFYMGCPISTLDPNFGKIDMKHMLNTTTPKLIFCDRNVYDLVKECLDELENAARIYTFGGEIGDSEPVETLFQKFGNEYTFMPTDVDGVNDIAAIVCSSGTTGLSKGVCLSHAGLSDSISRFNVMGTDDVLLTFSSLYWLTGLMFLVAGTVSGVKRIITAEPFTPELQFRLIAEYRITYIMNSPYQTTLFQKCDLIKSTDLSSLKYYFTGGSKIPHDVPLQINKYLPNGNVHIAFGMSEIAGVAAADFPTFSGRDTIGRMISGMSAKIIDENGNRCGINVDGELCLKGSHKFLGYYKNPEANNGLFDSEGFLLTGDIGHFDEDGYLYIVDRKKEILKYRNSQISPSSLEAHLIKSPLIKAVCIAGIPSDVDGDLAAACIVRSPGFDVDEEVVHKMIDDNFADYNKLRGGVYFVDSLPTTPSGKLLRRKVKEILIELYNKRKQ